MKCKYELDEVCVNADCPYCADFCPVAGNENVCTHFDNVKITNWQHISSMTSDEFANWFCNTRKTCNGCIFEAGFHFDCELRDWLNWERR